MTQHILMIKAFYIKMSIKKPTELKLIINSFFSSLLSTLHSPSAPSASCIFSLPSSLSALPCLYPD